MTQQNEEQADVAVRSFLAAELDPELGRAKTRFRAELWQQAQHARLGRRRGWLTTAVTSAAAACLGMVVTLAVLRQANEPRAGGGGGGGVPTNTTPVGSAPGLTAPMQMQRDVYWRTVDDGTIGRPGGDDSAVRQLRRQTFERVRWYDPRHGATIEVTRPQEQTIQVEVPKQ